MPAADHNTLDRLTAIGSSMSERGRDFWRSLDERADTEEFRAWVRNEFPAGVADGLDGVTRRQMLKVMAASFAMAGLTGCRNPSEGRIVPHVRSDEAAPVDRPLYYATAVTRDGFAQGVLVKSHAGRPTKVEGNPDHPASLGATDIFAQASILTLYDPDRSQAVYRGRDISTWAAAERALGERMDRAREQGGKGLRLLTGPTTSPTLLHQIRALLKELPLAGWHVHSAIDAHNRRAGARMAFGEETETVYRIADADVIVSFDADFLYGMPGSVRYARDFADRRRVRAASAGANRMNRLYVVEPCPSVTGTNADHRLAVPSGRIASLVRYLAAEVGVAELEHGEPELKLPAQVESWIRSMARDLVEHRGKSLVIAGDSQPPPAHALAHLLNEHLGNFNRTVMPLEPFSSQHMPEARSLSQLVQETEAGAVETLLIIDANPVYDAPVDFAFGERLSRVPFSAHMGLYRDETGVRCHWHLPMTHELESWGDARAFDGTVTLLQPLIEPLYEGRTPSQLVGVLSRRWGATGRGILEEHWRGQIRAEDFDTWLERTLERGVVPDSAARSKTTVFLKPSVTDSAYPAKRDGEKGVLEVNFQPDATVWDGRFANNGWLQELPRPLTKLTWDNAVLVSAKTAGELGARNEDVLELEYRGAKIRAPAWIVPGHADDCVTLPLGYGRWAGGAVGNGVGFSAYALRHSSAPWFDAGLRVRRTSDQHPLASTQHHQLMENRDLVRVSTFDQFVLDPTSHAHRPHADVALSLYPDRPAERPQWGMSIDLSTCIGCSACTVACQAENNIPVVGKDQVRRGREMHWIRVDRYFEGPLDNPAMHHQPVPCMHCENAPCEVVCPVAATTHSHDGLNEMTYNRCVGTRYCSNNCPYKVRRFNFLQYADLETPSLMLQRNPDVTVRERGVMEKCTYCVQRIRIAQIDARKENRPLRDGEVVTACQQACPTQAIVFGDVRDLQSRVSACKNQPHDYGLLADLNTRPRTTYLARVMNPSPELVQRSAVR